MTIRIGKRHRESLTTQLRLEQLEPRNLPSMGMPMAEMAAALALLPDASVTVRAVQSGAWSSPSTWLNGHVPAANDDVLIPVDGTVTLDSNTASAHTVRVDGTLQFASSGVPRLLVDTLVVNESGSLLISTTGARIIFTDNGPIDTNWDPTLISRGLISMGTVSLIGTATTPYVTLGNPALSGSTTLTLAATPVHWSIGDLLVLGGTSVKSNKDEERRISAISGTQVTLSAPLAYDHIAVAGGAVYAADVTRDVVLRSANQLDPMRHGHVMFMSNRTYISNVEFLGLGRTDKTRPLGETNPRGRYAVHFHRLGVDPTQAAAVVRGSTVVGSPGWGFVSHDSYVDFIRSVAYNVTGAGFVTEIGNEIGTFRNNLAIHSTGTGTLEDLDVNSRFITQDFGHGGDGFWFQGNGLHIQNNVAVGQRHAGFVLFSQGFELPGHAATEFLAANLPNPAEAAGQMFVSVKSVPLFDFNGNIAAHSQVGIEVWSQLGIPLSATDRSVINGFVAENDTVGMRLRYSQQTTVQNSSFLGRYNGNNRIAIHEANQAINDVQFVGLTITGWLTGLRFSEQGTGHVLTSSTFDNVHNIEIPSSFGYGRRIVISNMARAASSDPNHYDVFWNYELETLATRDISDLFSPDFIYFNAKQLYAPWQAADFVPITQQFAGAPAIPTELVGRTNQDLWNSYRIAAGGVIAPAVVASTLRTNGTVGLLAAYAPFLQLASNEYTNQLTGYYLQYNVAGTKNIVTVPTPYNLNQGWNPITLTIDDYRHTFFVYGDVTAPAFALDPNIVLTICCCCLADGFTLTGKVSDDSNAGLNVKFYFDNLDQLPVYTRADGSTYVLLQFAVKDRAGNTTPVTLQLTIVEDSCLTGH